MEKEEVIEFKGVVKEMMKNEMLRVKIEKENEIIENKEGRMRKKSISVMEGEKVMVEMKNYEMKKGRIK